MKRLILFALLLTGCTSTLKSAGPTEVYFGEPGSTEIEEIVVHEIDAARFQILVQAYGLTSEAIYDALDRAHKDRNVDVKVLLDKSNEHMASSKLRSLQREKIRVRIDDIGGIAHDKIIILDGQEVLTGSYNWTEHSKQNVENMLVIRDPTIAQEYIENWYGRDAGSRRPHKK